MEFSFDVRKVLPGRVTILETEASDSDIKIYDLYAKTADKRDPDTSWIYHFSANAPWDIKLKRKKEELITIIDNLGFASAQAQNLRSPITSLKKFLNSNQQRIYVLGDSENDKTVIGFLKIGIKRLFLCDEVGAHHELDPLCVLDFYVHESKQRCGFGHELFDIMLQNEKIAPDKLAIDRPSFKFLSFLGKHYDLKNSSIQSNNYVIFPSFFLNREVTRPPIFLYNGNAMQPEPSNKSKRQNSQPGNYTNEAKLLNSIQISLSANELTKNKTYYSSAAKCLMWNDEDKSPVHNKQYHSPNSSSRLQSSNIRNNHNLNLHSPMQSCSSSLKNFEGWGTNQSTPCSLTPVDNVPNYSRRKWEQVQSSWNIFGVKPIDYSIYHKQNQLTP